MRKQTTPEKFNTTTSPVVRSKTVAMPSRLIASDVHGRGAKIFETKLGHYVIRQDSLRDRVLPVQEIIQIALDDMLDSNEETDLLLRKLFSGTTMVRSKLRV